VTDQVPDHFMFDGRLWAVVDWVDGAPDVPTNEQLGFQTVMRSTANWSGRVDYFQVFRDQLYLFKIDAELREEDRELVPFGARKEVRIIYEPLESHGADGLRMIHREHRQDFLIFDDLKIGYSGKVILEHPVWDPWEFPWPLDEAELAPIYRAVLEFDEGILVGADIEVLREVDGS
jgi:hypothetical protein